LNKPLEDTGKKVKELDWRLNEKGAKETTGNAKKRPPDSG
jgi:hypothetical protein